METTPLNLSQERLCMADICRSGRGEEEVKKEDVGRMTGSAQPWTGRRARESLGWHPGFVTGKRAQSLVDLLIRCERPFLPPN